MTGEPFTVEEVPPDPERIMEGLRDTGYEFHTAVADIVDNSIAASAARVEINVAMLLGGRIRVSIADDGTGMDRDGLRNAMKYGAKKRPDPKSLGKFGLGLKTASTAFCRHLLVTSRNSKDMQPLTAEWDLDHIAKCGHWELKWSQPDRYAVQSLDAVARDSSGTVVVWEKVDRLIRDYARPDGVAASKALNREVEKLKRHLGMVYQRFLDPADTRERTLAMRVNGDPVLPWDPFCRVESELVATEEVEVELPSSGQASFQVRAFVLPRKEEFSSAEAAKTARLSNDAQGIYIYRENRLIHEADWLGMFQKEPHYTLSRVEFSFDHQLDEAFHIDIKKSQIQLSSELWEWLQETFLPPPRRAAQDRYRKGQKKDSAVKAKDSHDASNRTIGERAEALDVSRVDVKNAASGEVEITNSAGVSRVKLKLSTALKPNQFFVQPVDTLDDGLLWLPALIDGRKAVQINTSHPFYHKIYVPNLSESATVQGMDSLLWAISNAEFGVISNETKAYFADMRFIVSRALRQLVEDLPDPETDDAAD